MFDSLIDACKYAEKSIYELSKIIFSISASDKPLRPPRVIGKTRRAKIYETHIYYHCRSNC